MRKICRGRNGVIIGAVFNILLFSGRTASGLELVKDGKSCVTIVVAEDATSAHKWAAQQLQ